MYDTISNFIVKMLIVLGFALVVVGCVLVVKLVVCFLDHGQFIQGLLYAICAIILLLVLAVPVVEEFKEYYESKT